MAVFLLIPAKTSRVFTSDFERYKIIDSKAFMDKKYAKYLLEKTHQNYNQIADDFSRTRTYIWEELGFFGEYAVKGDKILDLGCGNGRLYELLKEKSVDYYGIDNSEKLIEIAKIRYPEVKFLVADALNLPFPDSFFDKVFSIAVLHHIPSEELRLKFLEEIKRVLKPGGLLVATVWDLWQIKTAWNILIQNTFLKILGMSKMDFKDVFYPWKSSEKKILVQRYFHLFTKKELENLIKRVDFKVKKSGIIKRGGKYSNICIVAEK